MIPGSGGGGGGGGGAGRTAGIVIGILVVRAQLPPLCCTTLHTSAAPLIITHRADGNLWFLQGIAAFAAAGWFGFKWYKNRRDASDIDAYIAASGGDGGYAQMT